jgi:cytochrome b involved in lipid metabolism
MKNSHSDRVGVEITGTPDSHAKRFCFVGTYFDVDPPFFFLFLHPHLFLSPTLHFYSSLPLLSKVYTMPELKTYTREEVKKHSVEGDAWIIIDAEVYNISTFADLHPGGAQILYELAGKDVTGKLRERQGSILTQFCTAYSV